MVDFSQYQSPFSWRYASQEMRSLWSELYKRKLWRKIWIALAKAQQPYGLVTPDQITELEANADQIDMPRAQAIEAEIHHDLMAELKTYAGQCPLAGGVLHMGATSMDIEDNADVLRVRASLRLVRMRLGKLLLVFADQIERTADLPVMAYTHLQPAEPTTLGYRLASYAQDLFEDFQALSVLQNGLRGKGFKGAVGTAAAYADLLGSNRFAAFEQNLSQELDLPFYDIATQTYPRKQDLQVINALAGLGASLYKMAFDLRLLQSPPIGETSEPFGQKQVGSSAMPFKRNPINAEKIDSLARMLSVLPQVAWNNAANSLLERTLDDSANRRSLLPDAFLISDELLLTAQRILKDLVVHPEAIQRNLATYAPFAATERILMASARQGADRQLMHERLREHALAAWAVIQAGRTNPLIERLQADDWIRQYLSVDEIAALADVRGYTGIASTRAKQLSQLIQATVAVEF
jgi:adenylosuccinate lyase